MCINITSFTKLDESWVCVGWSYRFFLRLLTIIYYLLQLWLARALLDGNIYGTKMIHITLNEFGRYLCLGVSMFLEKERLLSVATIPFT